MYKMPIRTNPYFLSGHKYGQPRWGGKEESGERRRHTYTHPMGPGHPMYYGGRSSHYSKRRSPTARRSSARRDSRRRRSPHTRRRARR